MRRFACWEEREVGRTIVDDANRDAPAVFSAVHRPSKIVRRHVRRRASEKGTAVDEHKVLEALVFEDPEDDRIIPIIGESGTGKSHLVRWLYANIPRSEERHVVYIEKRETGLRQVVHRILEGLDDANVLHHERFVDLRNKVDTAAAGLNPDTAPRQLLNQLSIALLEHGPGNATGEEREDREELIEKGLPDLITDPEFRKPLLAAGGVIATTVEKALGGGARDEEAPAFERLELEVRDVLDAAGVAQELRRDLYGSPELPRSGRHHDE